MSNERDDGGPAFPYLTASERDREITTHEGEHGMSLRDYFAAKAMQALVNDGLKRDGSATVANVAKDAYRMADAMLAERAK